MINTKRLERLRETLEQAQNPLFLYDNDVDGFCAFLLLRRAIERGKGVAIKTYPQLREQYLRKVDEFNTDLVVVLDKAEIDESFYKGLQERNTPLVWIDHHNVKLPGWMTKEDYYNTYPTSEPTSYIAHNVFKRKKDDWLAMIGCIGDVYLPDFTKAFKETYPELLQGEKNAFEILQTTELGTIVRMINFGLMDSITHVVQLTKYLFHAQGPHDITEENKHTKQFHQRYKELNDLYQRHVQKAKEKKLQNNNTLFYSYSGTVSMSSEIANKLSYEYPKKLVIVAFVREDKANISIRGTNALKKTKQLITNIPGATGGGHEEATGAMIPIDYFEEFKERVQEMK